MKTAMQEHFEWLQENQLFFGIPIEAIDNAEDLLEKEKEQIINAYEDGKENQRDSITNIYNYIIGEFYYNKTYNQNES